MALTIVSFAIRINALEQALREEQQVLSVATSGTIASSPLHCHLQLTTIDGSQVFDVREW
jgi:hypothetical protein